MINVQLQLIEGALVEGRLDPQVISGVEEGKDAPQHAIQEVVMLSSPLSLGRLDLASIEVEKDRVNRDIIIYQDPEENIVSCIAGRTSIGKLDVLVKELDQWEDLLTNLNISLKASRSLNFGMESEFLLSPKPRKKNVREPSLDSLVETRSSCKSNVGSTAKRGKKSEKEAREEETRRSLANGHQRNLQECSKN